MRSPSFLRATAALALVVLGTMSAQAQPYSGLFIFGDSLSDSGNNALATAPLTGLPNGVPQGVTSNGYIPTFPYAPQPGWNNVGSFATYSNGQVWASWVAQGLGFSGSQPSLSGGTNFAFGGARTLINGSGPNGVPPSVSTVVGGLLAATGGSLPVTPLYVVAVGGNDARDALSQLGISPTLPQIVSTVSQASAQYAIEVGNIVDRLQAAGAQDIVVWNVPNIGVAPAVTALGPQASGLASLLVQNMNAALNYRLASESGVEIFDVFGLINQVTANPSSFGFSNVTDACVTGLCSNPDDYLFWDGIHPTAAAHRLLGNAFLTQVGVVPEPSAVWLMMAGLAGFGLVLRRRT